MNDAEQMQSKKKLKPLQQTQNFLQDALQSVTQAQSLENNQAMQQTEQNIQKAQQTLDQSLANTQNQQEKDYIEIAQQQLLQAEQKLLEASHTNKNK